MLRKSQTSPFTAERKSLISLILQSFEIVAVEFLHSVGFVVRHRYAVVDHVLGQLLTVDHYDAKVSLGSRFSRSGRESPASDEDALVCLMLTERSNEFADCSGA